MNSVHAKHLHSIQPFRGDGMVKVAHAPLMGGKAWSLGTDFSRKNRQQGKRKSVEVSVSFGISLE